MNIWPQEPYSEGEAAIEIAVERSRARHSRRNRETPGTQSTPSGRLCRQARHHLDLVSKARRQEVRWLQTAAVSGPPCGCSGSGSPSGANGAREYRLGI